MGHWSEAMAHVTRVDMLLSGFCFDKVFSNCHLTRRYDLWAICVRKEFRHRAAI